MTNQFRNAGKGREELRKQILLHVLKNANEFLTVHTPSGESPVIVAFEDELIRDVFEKASWTDGYANIIVSQVDSLAIIPTEPSAARGAHCEHANVLPVADSCDLGMLIHGLKIASVNNEPVQLRVHGAMKSIRVLQHA